MNFMRICWGRPPGLGMAIGRARRQAGSLCLSDSAEGGIALPSAIPPKAESALLIAALRAADIQKQVCTVQI